MNRFMNTLSHSLLRSLISTFSLTLPVGLLALGALSCSGSGIPESYPNPKMVNGIYAHAFGDPRSTAVIFIHDSFGDPSIVPSDRVLGGPSLNSMYFEFGAAEKLAEKNFYVVTYDLRGQGRSADARNLSDYSYQQSAADIKSLILSFNLSLPIIIGHSHGGLIALKFDELNPGASRKIVLVDTPTDVFQMLGTISANCLERYNKVGESSKVVEMKDTLDTLSNANSPHQDRSMLAIRMFERAGTCGGGSGLFSTKAPSADALKFYKMISTLQIPISKSNQTSALNGFLANEDYIHLNVNAYVSAHNDHIVGLYGSEDGFFDSNALSQIKTSLAVDAHPERFAMIDAASHNSFIDQRNSFIDALNAMLIAK